MGQVVQFPQRMPSKLFGLFHENKLIAAQHLVRSRKAQYVPVHELPDALRKSALGEYARHGVRVDGHAIGEFKHLCTY